MTREEYEKKICEDFPFMQARNVFSGDLCLDKNGEPYCFPLDFGDEWLDIFYEACQKIKKVFDKYNFDYYNFRNLQIKEKYGSLRWYYNALPEKIYEEVQTIILDLEDKSIKIYDKR